MFAVLGFVAAVLLMVYVTLFAALVLFNCAGTYSIGGVPNSLFEKLGSAVFVVFIAWLWYELLINAPFTLNLSM